MIKKRTIVIFVIYLLLGLYLINLSINYITISQGIKDFETWIFFISGMLLIFASIKFLFKRKKREEMSEVR